MLRNRYGGLPVSREIPMANRRGADYIEALRDRREVWHAGRRIEDVAISWYPLHSHLGAVLDYVAPHHQAGGVPRRCPAFDPMERA